MSRIEKRVVIDHSTERIFCYIDEPVASPEVWPGLLEVREVHYLSKGVRYASYLYKITGVVEPQSIQFDCSPDSVALPNQSRNWDLVMTLNYQPDRANGPRLALDGDHVYWSLC